MKFDLFKIISKIPNENLQRRLLDHAIEWAIPFNKNLKFHIKQLDDKFVAIESPHTHRRKNHIGGAHACALALLGEYPAGILIAKHYTPEQFRFIIAHLSVNYFKQGRGLLTAETKAPAEWPEIKEGEVWIEMTTTVSDDKNEKVAEIFTRWQVKTWSMVRKATP